MLEHEVQKTSLPYRAAWSLRKGPCPCQPELSSPKVTAAAGGEARGNSWPIADKLSFPSVFHPLSLDRDQGVDPVDRGVRGREESMLRHPQIRWSWNCELPYVGRLMSRIPRLPGISVMMYRTGCQPVVLKPKGLVVTLLLSLPAQRTSRTSVRSSAPVRWDYALNAKRPRYPPPFADLYIVSITRCTPGNWNPLLTCVLRPGVQLTTFEARRFRRNAAAFTDIPVAPATQVNGAQPATESQFHYEGDGPLGSATKVNRLTTPNLNHVPPAPEPKTVPDPRLGDHLIRKWLHITSPKIPSMERSMASQAWD
ncbi:hypothetical protein VTN00DRAFT_1232 [Thermoascus crustaceus]|uniref:uncharacterized protein n=1 Tax=Thermoascus crustaceus TaxID=5088 RepID=UPI003744043A